MPLADLAWLARSASAVGTAQVSGSGSLGYLPGTADGRGWGRRLLAWQCSGNQATADLLVPLHGDPVNGPWISATSLSMAAGATGSAMLTGYYPWMVLQLSWVSGGVRTATVNVSLQGGPPGF